MHQGDSAPTDPLTFTIMLTLALLAFCQLSFIGRVSKLLVTLVLIVLLLILWIRWNGQTSPPASPGMDMPEVAPELSGVTD
jgi:hypothetical protein